MKTRLPAALFAVLAAAGVTVAADETAHPDAPTMKQLRSATVRGVLQGTSVRLRGGAYTGAPYVPGGAERLRVELMKSFTAAGDLDAAPGDERVALLTASSGGTGVRVYLAVFAMRDRKVEDLATILVGDRVEPKALSIDGRTIALDVVEPGPNDLACCPSRVTRRAYWLGPGGLTAFADVPFDLVRGQIVFRASTGKVEGLNVVLDTGAEASSIDPEIAARIGQPGSDASGFKDLQIGGEIVPSIDARAVDLSAISRGLGLEIAGVFGYEFLKDRIVEIDYPRRRLRLLPDAPSIPKGGLVVPFKTAGGDRRPLIEHLVMVNGTGIPVTLDTGSGLGLEVFANARGPLGAALWSTPGRTGHVESPHGEVSARTIPIGSVAIGGFALETRELTLSNRSGENGPRMGNLGNEALAPFVVTLNYRDGLVVVAKP